MTIVLIAVAFYLLAGWLVMRRMLVDRSAPAGFWLLTAISAVALHGLDRRRRVLGRRQPELLVEGELLRQCVAQGLVVIDEQDMMDGGHGWGSLARRDCGNMSLLSRHRK